MKDLNNIIFLVTFLLMAQAVQAEDMIMLRRRQDHPHVTGEGHDARRGTPVVMRRLTDNGDGTVTDEQSKLVWLKVTNCFGSQTWPSAVNSAKSLASGQCGLTDGSVEGDWRLPGVQEWESLVDLENSHPVLPSGHPFSGVVSTDFWSSSPNRNNADLVWFVNLDYGGVSTCYKTSSNQVWPVRGGQ
ncbi:MAG: DUF1566 domain-containing protein [Magnetococcus sp. WYHC-3]